MEIDLSKLTPDIRKLYDMKEVIFDKEWLKTAPNMDLYYMYRNLKQENGLKYNITVIKSLMLGSEFAKTAGHNHAAGQMELYNIIEGEAFFLMQKGDAEKIEDVYAVHAKAGESAVIKNFYGHATINPSGKDLKTQDWSPIETKSDYSMFQELHGACYYYTTTGWVKNENYKNIPELRFEQPLKSIPQDLEFLKKG